MGVSSCITIFSPPSAPNVKPLVMMICIPGWLESIDEKASEKGHIDIVKTLIEADANVIHTNKVTPAFYMYRPTVLMHYLSSKCVSILCMYKGLS